MNIGRIVVSLSHISSVSQFSGMSEEEQERYASVVADCAKTSTELLNVAKEFYIQLQKEKERDVGIILKFIHYF